MNWGSNAALQSVPVFYPFFVTHITYQLVQKVVILYSIYGFLNTVTKLEHGIAERKVHKFVLLLSANKSCSSHPIDQWECSHFEAHNLWDFLTNFPCSLPHILSLIPIHHHDPSINKNKTDLCVGVYILYPLEHEQNAGTQPEPGNVVYMSSKSSFGLCQRSTHRLRQN